MSSPELSRPAPLRRSAPGCGPAGLIGPAAVLAVLARPELWSVALRVIAAQAEPGWWRRWPPLPRLPDAYARFRRQTMWGSEHGGRLGGPEAVEYLRWVDAMRRSARASCDTRRRH